MDNVQSEFISLPVNVSVLVTPTVNLCSGIDSTLYTIPVSLKAPTVYVLATMFPSFFSFYSCS